MPRTENSKAGYLLELIRIQAITRREARNVVLGESPLVDETAQVLLSKITELQSTNPLCIYIRRKISTKISTTSCDSYFLDQTGLLLYKGRIVVFTQKALT